MASSHSAHRLFLWYAVLLWFISLGDALMGYIAPVLMQQAVGSVTLMGMILASSSVVGSLMDFSFAKMFTGKRHEFFLRILISLVIFFPLTFLIHQAVPSFLFAMAVWGVYFEAMVFSNYHAVHEFVPVADHAWAWGVLSVLRNLALVIGPLGASYLLERSASWALGVALLCYLGGIVLFLSHRKLNPFHDSHSLESWRRRSVRTVAQEWGIWKTFGRVTWPLLGLLFLFFCIDAAFYGIGPLLTEELKHAHPLGIWFVSLYSIPGLSIGFVTGKIAAPFGKKRAAFAGGLIAGGALIAMTQVGSSVPWILGFTFIASIGLCILYPELVAVFEDFVARSGGLGNDLIGLTTIMGSLAYVVGPILNGYLADKLGYLAVFGLWGGVLSLYSLVLFAMVKRKTRLPQKAARALLFARRFTKA